MQVKYEKNREFRPIVWFRKWYCHSYHGTWNANRNSYRVMSFPTTLSDLEWLRKTSNDWSFSRPLSALCDSWASCIKPIYNIYDVMLLPNRLPLNVKKCEHACSGRKRQTYGLRQWRRRRTKVCVCWSSVVAVHFISTALLWRAFIAVATTTIPPTYTESSAWLTLTTGVF